LDVLIITWVDLDLVPMCWPSFCVWVFRRVASDLGFGWSGQKGHHHVAVPVEARSAG
jgi:hypothetical protein